MAQFTAVTLNLDGPSTRNTLLSPERIHATIEKSLDLAGPRTQDEARTQWRLDGDTLLIVSDRTPDEKWIAQNMNVTRFRSKNYEGILNNLQANTRWVFRCKANATIKLSDGTKKYDVPLCHENDLFAWMDRQGIRHGFHVTRDRLNRPELTIRKERVQFRKTTGKVTLATSIFDGILSIDDPDMFRNALLTGIGRAKAYGNGLITLARLKDYQR